MCLLMMEDILDGKMLFYIYNDLRSHGTLLQKLNSKISFKVFMYALVSCEMKRVHFKILLELALSSRFPFDAIACTRF